MGLRGDGIAESVPTCFSFVQGVGTDLGNPTWWPNCRHYLGEAVTANYYAEFAGNVVCSAACQSRLGKGRNV